MKLGQKLFKKDQSIWGKPIIEYDQTKMDALFSEIQAIENGEEKIIFSDTRDHRVSLETELYLMLHS
ncbi:hypothetical protein [Maribacter halichondriae]|uniref:hypothetical protein n=1 Tax=Maribacter halichondriae TaxID=2980554 RepID=UPI002359A7BF|nr:hypothetical protein [Maribacter sp. Hal144]